MVSLPLFIRATTLAQPVKIPLPLASPRPARSCAAREYFGKVFSLSCCHVLSHLGGEPEDLRPPKWRRSKFTLHTVSQWKGSPLGSFVVSGLLCQFVSDGYQNYANIFVVKQKF